MVGDQVAFADNEITHNSIFWNNASEKRES